MYDFQLASTPAVMLYPSEMHIFNGAPKRETYESGRADVPGTIRDSKHKHSHMSQSTQAAVVCLNIILLCFA